MNTIQTKTLNGISLATIITAFNEAFSDYIIKLQFTEESMAAKMRSEGILLKYSVGAFTGSKLVGFILHAFDTINGVPTIYNAGTGVVPGYRGKGITAAMYEYSIPLLQKEGIHSHVLEVIDTNHYAIKVYEATGFVKHRNLVAFKSNGPIHNNPAITIQPIDTIPSAAAFHSIAPAWQNTTASIERDRKGHSIIGAFQEGELVGYAAFVPEAARVKQLGVHQDKRAKGVGKALLAHVYKASDERDVVITNIDASNEPIMRFLEAMQFKQILGLYEMKMKVPL